MDPGFPDEIDVAEEQTDMESSTSLKTSFEYFIVLSSHTYSWNAALCSIFCTFTQSRIPSFWVLKLYLTEQRCEEVFFVIFDGRPLGVRDSRFQSHILFPLCHDFPRIRVFILNHENHVGKRYNEREKKTGDTLAFHKRIFFTPLYPLIRISYKPISARVTPPINRNSSCNPWKKIILYSPFFMLLKVT